MPEEKKVIELNDEELEKVNGGNNNQNGPFAGLDEGDIYQSIKGTYEYAKIYIINRNNDNEVHYHCGVKQGSYIKQVGPSASCDPYIFKSKYDTSVKITEEWRRE